MSRSIVARVLHAINVARLTLVDDSGVVQKLQVSERAGTDGQPTLTDGVFRVADYGHASNPPIGSDIVLVRPWGDRTQTLALGSNHQASRPTGLSNGDSLLYSNRGQKVWLSDGTLVVDGGGAAIEIRNFSTCQVVGTLQVTGDVIANFGGAAVSLVNHVHGLTGGPDTTVPLPSDG